MTEAYKRLQQARFRAGYENATDAARAFGWNENTYRSHENGERGITRAAEQYARAFRVSRGWLLTGEGDLKQEGIIPVFGHKGQLTHLNEAGEARMVDVSAKPRSARLAVAQGCVAMAPETLALCLAGQAKKGDVFAAARIAGIMAAKRTSELIPLCHPLNLSKIEVDVEADPALPGLRLRAAARTVGETGVEMEALTAVAVACLTIYDMLKAADRAMRIEGVLLVEKTGGESGDYIRKT